MRNTRGQARECSLKSFMGYSFIIKGKAYSFIIKGKAERGKGLLLPHFGIDIELPSSTPPPRWAGEFSCFYVIKLGLLWYNGNGPEGGNVLKCGRSSQASV